jgi:hypothetical protein
LAANAKNCTDNCLPTCKRIQYDLSRTINTILWGDIFGVTSNCDSLFTISPWSFQYPQYTEQFEWTFFSYIAGLGGTVGILLGIDIIMSTEFLLAIANWLFAFAGRCWCWLSPKKNEAGEEESIKEIKTAPRSLNTSKSRVVVVRAL